MKLGGVGWKELQIKSVIPRYATRQQNGMILCVIIYKQGHTSNIPFGQGMYWLPVFITMDPVGQKTKNVSMLVFFSLVLPWLKPIPSVAAFNG